MHKLNIRSLSAGDERPAPDGFRSRRRRLGAELGSAATGATVYDLGPGQAVCPYHYEHGEEEWVLAVAGRPSIRTPDGVEELEPFDVVFLPTGPAGAHQVRNDSGEPARVLIWSNVVFPTSTVYPDSDKVGVYTRDRDDDLILPRSAGVDYFDGESVS
jgi:uncharacterized cupin superfamily protein